MPIIKSAKKRVRVTEKRTAINRRWKEKYKNALRAFEEAVEEGDVEEVAAQLRETTKIVDKTASKGLIHKNKAARKKSQMAKKLNELKE